MSSVPPPQAQPLPQQKSAARLKSQVLILIAVLGVLWLAILGPGWYWYSVRNPSLKGGTYLVLRVNTDDAAKVSGVREVIRRRLRDIGLANPAVEPHGQSGDQLLVSLPIGVNIGRAKALMANDARLEIRLVEDGPAADEQTLLATRGNLPDGMEVVPGPVTAASSREYYLVRRTAVITGADVVKARSTVDELFQPAISFTLSNPAVETFSRATGENVGRQLAIMLDGVVVSAPSIRERIAAGDVMITGTFTKQEAADLALMLRNGSLPASVTFLEEGITK